MNLDLNLLVGLDALLEEGSVGGAADRLRLSQPAMSRTLGRIRRATGDRILVRSGRVMLPTPYAEAVREQVHALVEQARALLGPTGEVDPTSLDRTFTLRCHDALTHAAGPAIVAAVRAAAPGVRLRFLAESAVDDDDLRRGRVDLEIAAGLPRQPDLRSEIVGGGTLLAVVRTGHPARTLTSRSYAAYEHVTVSRRGRLHDPLDEALRAEGLNRRVVVSVPTTAAAFRLVASSDLVVAVPEVLARAGLDAAGLRSMALPLTLPPVDLAMSWHLRYDGDAAHSWLRARVRGALSTAGVTAPGPGQPLTHTGGSPQPNA
ncbi:LysR family transcriptional regulator [Streptomyces sp. SL54]|uniref:LysR family transcriptional regulator n=1 Tax=Streptantibioticus silvisoli TaxID=2705255 RepID=A0ABT6W2I7_9ACTN|nr:LysR family transcriptional regulator [Streptantibioticus silvisoli]